MNLDTKSAESKKNFETMTAEELVQHLNFEKMPVEKLIQILGSVAKQLEKRVLTDIKHTRDQVEKLAKTIGLEIPSSEKVKPESKWEAAKETLKEPVHYQHPDNETLVWVKGSGRKPKWLNDLTRKEGWKLEDLEVKPKQEEPRAEEPK